MFAGTDAELVAGCDGGERDVFFAAVLDESMRDGRGEVHERADRGISAGVGALFEDLAEENDGGDERGGLEVERDAVRGEKGRGKFFAEENGEHAEEVGRAGAGDREREHVGVAVAEGDPPAADEVGAAPKENGRGEEELRPRGEAQRERVKGVRSDHRTHRENQDGERERGGDVEARAQDVLVGQAHVNRGVGRGGDGRRGG